MATAVMAVAVLRPLPVPNGSATAAPDHTLRQDFSGWPTSWHSLGTDAAEAGCANHRNVTASYYALDVDFLYLRLTTVSPAGWPSANPSGEARYKWFIDTGNDAALLGTTVLNADWQAVVEDRATAPDPTPGRNQLGELTLLDDLANVGFTTRWGGGSPAGYMTNAPGSSWWQRVVGSGTPGAGGTQQATADPDVGYRLDGTHVDVYVARASLDGPTSLRVLWATTTQGSNLDNAPACDAADDFVTLPDATPTPAESAAPSTTPTTLPAPSTTPTSTASAIPTAGPTPSSSATPAASATGTATPTATATRTATPTGTSTPTLAPTTTASATPTMPPTAAPTATPTPLPSMTATPTGPPTPTTTATATRTATIAPSPTAVPSATPSAAATASPAATAGPTPTAPSAATATASPPGTVAPTLTPSTTPSPTRSPTATRSPTSTRSPTATRTATGTPTPSATATSTRVVTPRADLCHDLDGDDVVTTADLETVLQRWGLSSSSPDPDGDPATPNYEPRFDLVANGDIDAADVVAVGSQIGLACP